MSRIRQIIIENEDGSLVSVTDPLPVEFQNTEPISVEVYNTDLAIAKGDISGSTFIHKFGNVPDFDSTDGIVTVWDGADDAGIDEMQYTYSATAIIDSISSAAVGDTQEVKIQGLDSNWDLITQTATLNGQTSVALPTSLIRIFRIKNNGTTDFAGNVYVYEATPLAVGVPILTGKIRAMVHATNNQTLMSLYTIPNGKTGYLTDWYAAIAGANKTSNYIIELLAREFGKVFQLKHLSAVVEGGSSYIQHKYQVPEKFAAKVDIEMRVSLSASPITGASFSAGFDITLVDD